MAEILRSGRIGHVPGNRTYRARDDVDMGKTCPMRPDGGFLPFLGHGCQSPKRESSGRPGRTMRSPQKPRLVRLMLCPFVNPAASRACTRRF